MTKSGARVVGVHEAKTHLSRLLQDVENGVEVQINRGATPVARLVPVTAATTSRQLGTLRGLISVPDDFDDTDESLIETFEDGGLFPR